MEKMEHDIGYIFENKNLLKLAFTHVSYANEEGIESNQRLEFLGDSVLSFVISSLLYEKFCNFEEGDLTKIRAFLACENSLAEIGKSLNLNSMIKFGKSEKQTNGSEKASILADTFEALIGAIFLDSNIETVKNWLLKFLKKKLNNYKNDDYKSLLQIFLQKKHKTREVVVYNLKKQSGPDHDPWFLIEAVYLEEVIGKGEGKNKKEAQQAAAKQAFNFLTNT